MKKFILIILTIIQIAFSSTLHIENAKIGSTILKDYSISKITPVVGHAGVVVDEYTYEDDWDFIVEASSTLKGLETTTSYKYFLGDNKYLGHYRAKSKNYTEEERILISRAARQAINTNADYEFYNLYIYDWDFKHENNIPYNINIVPSDFRCDGLAEWATEVATASSAIASQSDGFYEDNSFGQNIPRDITQSPIDAIGIPDAPTLTQTDTDVNASFSDVSGAWSKALYALYRSTVQSPYVSDLVYCGHSRFYRDEITDNMEGEYFYYLKVGERTASCSNAESDFSNFSEFSEYSKVVIKKCKSPELFEVVSQTDVNTSDWRVSVKNLETNETQENVLPFNPNGSLYQLENKEWVLASCNGKAYTTTWEGSHGIYQLDNPQEEKIVFERFEFTDEDNLTIIDNKTSLVWNNTNLSQYSWSDANKICAELFLDSYEEWRMPTFEELVSIGNPTSDNHVYDEFFTALDEKPYGYWSSTTMTFWTTYWGYETDSKVLSYINASYHWIDTQYDMNFMCVQQL